MNDTMPSNQAKALSEFDLGSPHVVSEIDTMLVRLWALRKLAADLHGDKSLAPLMPLAEKTEPQTKAPAPRGDSFAAAVQPKGDGDYDGTIRSLIHRYKTDKDSAYQKLRFRSRESYGYFLKYIDQDHGSERVESIDARVLLAWHQEWTKRGVTMAAGLISHVRTIMTYGSTFLADEQCRRVRHLLSDMRFPQPPVRDARLTLKMATDFRSTARKKGFPSMALAQAIQFECRLRQKDAIGEWLPQDEPIESDVHFEGKKWVRGLRWNFIDEHLVLRHVTSKQRRPIEANLQSMPMVMEELRARYAAADGTINRSCLPSSGPMIISEVTGRPYSTPQFRQLWRELANEAGIPKTIHNADSRVGVGDRAADVAADDDDEPDVDLTLEFEQGAGTLPH